MELYRLIAYTLTNIFSLVFLTRFLPLRYSLKKSWAFGGLCIGILFAFDIVRFILPVNDRELIYILIAAGDLLLVQFTAFFLSEYHDARTVFTALFASNYVIVGNILGVVALVWTDSLLVGAVVGETIHVLLLLFMNFRVRNVYFRQQQWGSTGWLSLCLIPSLFYISLFLLAFYPHSLYMNTENVPVTLFVLASMSVAYFVVLGYGESYADRQEAQQRNMLLEMYIKGVELQMATISATEQDMNILRHDMRHYLGALSVMLEQGQYGEAKKVLSSLVVAVNGKTTERYCENPMINAVLCSLTVKASLLGVTVQSSLAIPKENHIDSMELAAVIGNLLDNAINGASESTGEERTVHMFARRIENQLIIEVCNPYGGDVTFHPISGLPISRRGTGHGFGMQSIAAFVNKNNASFDCFCENNLFIARLLLSL